MGGQNAVARKLAAADFTTTVLTLTITGIFADGSLAGGASSKSSRRFISPFAMFAGALAGALFILHVNVPLCIGVVLIILCLVAARTAVGSRSPRSQ